MRIAVIGPHPDDQELNLGGTIAILRQQGHDVTLVDVTTGEPTPFGTPEIRARESQAAADVLGVTRLAVGLKNREVVHNIESRHRMAAVYRQLRPDLIFIPYGTDAHPDHLAVTRIAEDARFDAKLTKSTIPGDPWHCRRILYYFASHLRFNFPASFCMDISPVIDLKMRAIDCYQSQFYTGRSGADFGAVPAYVKSINAYFGGTINRPFAEPLFSQEMLGLGNIDGLITG